jgi:serine protease AprX
MNKKLDIILSVILVVLIIIALVLCTELLLKYILKPYFYEVTRSEWAFSYTQVTALNKLGYLGKNVTIGIIDTGISLEHPDLSSINVIAWYDFINNREEPYDDNGHGTHIAGILAANGKLKGIAPSAKLIIAKALRGDGTGEDEVIASAIRFCMDPNSDDNFTDAADIICLSLGGRKIPALGTKSENACKEAVGRGIFVVAAAGNDYPNRDVATPGTVELVISVGAIDKTKTIASFSSKGWNIFRDHPNEKPELVAPGVSIVSTWSPDYYTLCSGTSQAAPFVAGAIALVLDAYPQYQQEYTNNSTKVVKLKLLLASTAEKLDNQAEPHDNRYGYGLVNALGLYKALQ